MTFRKVLFWMHLICGVAAGIIITLMSITGVLLTYEKQMTAQADRSLYAIDPPAGAEPLSVEVLVEALRETRPDAIPVSVSIASNPEMPASVTTTANEAVILNPFTGEILGPGVQGIRRFFRLMTDLHRWLALSGEDRLTGRAVTGACNLAFLFIIVSGIYLWWPRKWTRPILRSILWFRREKSARARDFNWHHVFGFWSIVPLILVVASGVVISYPWASDLVFRVAGSQPPAGFGPPGKSKPPPKGPAAKSQNPQIGYATTVSLELTGLDSLVSDIGNRTDGWDTISFRLPVSGDKTVTFTVDSGAGIQPQFRSTVVADRNSGEIIRAESFKDMDPGLRLRIWFRFVHTGEYYGFTGQTIAGIVSAASILLVWTGFALSIRRCNAWNARR